jgi:PAS domain-containing protein
MSATLRVTDGRTVDDSADAVITALRNFPIADARLTNWSFTSSKLIGLAQLLAAPPASALSYEFLQARLILVSEVRELMNTTLPEIATPPRGSPTVHRLMIGTFFTAVLLLTIFAVVIRKRQQSWFYGAEILIRRGLMIDPALTYFVRETLLGCEPGYLEEIPLAVIVRNAQGVIEFANRHAVQFSRHTVNQTIGQKFAEFFDEASSNLDFEVTPFGDGLEFVIIRDADERRNRTEKYERLMRRVRTAIPNPDRRNCTYLDVRVNSEGMEPEVVFEVFERAEREKIGIQKLDVSVAMMRAICEAPAEALMVAIAITERFGERSRAAVTQGEITLVSLAEGDALVIACGTPVRRAEDCVVNGCWGRVYVDETVRESLDAEFLAERGEMIVGMCPTVRQFPTVT